MCIIENVDILENIETMKDGNIPEFKVVDFLFVNGYTVEFRNDGKQTWVVINMDMDYEKYEELLVKYKDRNIGLLLISGREYTFINNLKKHKISSYEAMTYKSRQLNLFQQILDTLDLADYRDYKITTRYVLETKDLTDIIPLVHEQVTKHFKCVWGDFNLMSVIAREALEKSLKQGDQKK